MWHADRSERKILTPQRAFLFVYSSQRWTHSSYCSLHLAQGRREWREFKELTHESEREWMWGRGKGGKGLGVCTDSFLLQSDRALLRIPGFTAVAAPGFHWCCCCSKAPSPDLFVHTVQIPILHMANASLRPTAPHVWIHIYGREKEVETRLSCADRWSVLSVKRHHRPHLPWGRRLAELWRGWPLPSVPLQQMLQTIQRPHVSHCVSYTRLTVMPRAEY